jgi:iron(III) transport system permease protein
MSLKPVRLGWSSLAAGGFAGFYALFAVILPLFALCEAAFRRNLYVADFASLFDVAQFSLVNMSRALASPAVHDGLWNSLIIAGATAILGTTFFFTLAYVVARTRLPGRGLMEYLAMAPLALPALVMGLGILWTWVAVPLPVYGTMAILIIAFVTRFLPQGFRTVSASISQVHEDLEQAAMVAGATPFRAMRRIVYPLVRPGILSAAFLTIILSLRELTASLFLYTTNTRLLSIVIFEAYENGSWGAVASISLIYTSLLIVLTLLGRRWMGVSLGQSSHRAAPTSGVTHK